ncbi:hypothetical protein BGX28_008436 [Mortierella sp. GBA30]|nr:hypothetical protein BGX28_008436 [Mortierella sp. GBA30]
MDAPSFARDMDALYRIPLITDGPWSAACLEAPRLCNRSPKFNISRSSTSRYEPESIAVKYTEDYTTDIFSEIVRELPLPVFSLTFADTWGTLTLGGVDPAFYSGSLTWMKTLPDEAGWVAKLSSRIELHHRGTEGINSIQTDLDRVWFDSGTTFIWGDEKAIKALNARIGVDSVTGQLECSKVPMLGNIVFFVGGSDSNTAMRLELSPAEYIIGTVSSRRCFSALNVSSPKKDHWTFGVHVLRGFYTVYHYGFGLVGIASYNITETNPTGRLVVPGSHAALNNAVNEFLQQTLSSASSFKPSLTSHLIPAIITFMILCTLLPL